jgi:hypothetical protein
VPLGYSIAGFDLVGYQPMDDGALFVANFPGFFVTKRTRVHYSAEGNPHVLAYNGGIVESRKTARRT